MQTRTTTGRVVLVTGAAGGIGGEITKALLEAGHAVAAVDRNAATLDRLVARWRGTSHAARLHPVLADLAGEAACTQAVAAAQSHFGRLEAIVNNAGIGMSSIRPDAETRHPGIAELTPAIWDDFFAINVRAPFLVTRAALPAMQRERFGRVINNTTSFRTMLRVLPYGASKSALESMSAVWAEELKGEGITVNVLIPGGPTDTPFISDAAGWPREQMLKPAIMGPPAVWLVSGEAGDFTGMRIVAARWDAKLPGREAAQASSRAIGWPELGADAVWLAARPG
jgi:NAD(P)-dependent dehydrogenase (short-subunit alcohol dehydrogenase family)